MTTDHDQQNPDLETPEQAAEHIAEHVQADAAIDTQEIDLVARVADLETQLRDVQLRAQADVQNAQRRAERDVTNAHKFALEKFANGLLDVVDNLERALDVTPEDEANKAFRDGIVLTHKSFIDTLKRFGVEQVNPVGEPFNAEFHQAISMVPSPTAEPNSVLNVLAKGYTLSGRLLRPAMVVVAAAS